jgi:hypothetical protein
MSEDVNTTPEGDATPEAPEPKAPGLPQEYAWISEATPAQIAEAIQKLQEKSTTRLETLTAKDAELERLRAEKQQAEDAKLAEQKKFEELANNRAAEIETLKQSIAEKETAAKRKELEFTVLAKASFLGFADPADAINLMDISTLENEDKAVTAALKTLAESKPYLLKGQQEQQRKLSPLHTSASDRAQDLSWVPLNPASKSPFGDGGVQPPGE